MTHDEKKFMNKCWIKSLLTSLKGFLNVVFVFFMTSVLRNTCTVSKFKLNIFFLFGVCLSLAILYIVLNVLCILYKFLCYCYRHVDYTSSCAVVWPIKLTNKKTVETCDFLSDNFKKNLKISEMYCKHDLVNWYSISLVKVKSFSEPWRNIRPALCFPWS